VCSRRSAATVRAAFLGDGDEVAKMSQLHGAAHAYEVWGQTYKVFFLSARRT